MEYNRIYVSSISKHVEYICDVPENSCSSIFVQTEYTETRSIQTSTLYIQFEHTELTESKIPLSQVYLNVETVFYERSDVSFSNIYCQIEYTPGLVDVSSVYVSVEVVPEPYVKNSFIYCFIEMDIPLPQYYITFLHVQVEISQERNADKSSCVWSFW